MARLPFIVLPWTLFLSAGSELPDQGKSPSLPLWAGVSVNRPVFDRSPRIEIPGDDPPRVVLSFTLINDSNGTIDTELRASKLFINGEEFKDWVFNLSNGPQDERRSALPPGEYLLFSHGMDKYFLKSGLYKVVWKGKSFQSGQVEFRVVGPNP